MKNNGIIRRLDELKPKLLEMTSPTRLTGVLVASRAEFEAIPRRPLGEQPQGPGVLLVTPVLTGEEWIQRYGQSKTQSPASHD